MEKLEGPDYLSLVIEWNVVDDADVLESIPEPVPTEIAAFEDITARHSTEHKGILGKLALAVVGLGSLIVLAARLRRAHSI